MAEESGEERARFGVGQLIRHRRFDYRGVVVDVDSTFQGTDEWYDAVARSRPPKNRPWYHVLPHGAEHMTYVAERHLEADPSEHLRSDDLLFYPYQTQGPQASVWSGDRRDGTR